MMTWALFCMRGVFATMMLMRMMMAKMKIFDFMGNVNNVDEDDNVKGNSNYNDDRDDGDEDVHQQSAQQPPLYSCKPPPPPEW